MTSRLPFGQLRELDEQIDLLVAVPEVPDAAKSRERPEQAVAPAMALPGPARHDEEPALGLRDGATLAEGVLEGVLDGVGGVLRTGAHGDQCPVDLRIRRFTSGQPIAVAELDGNLPR